MGGNFLFFFLLLLSPGQFTQAEANSFHPFYVSVVEVQQNTAEKSLELSFRIFTDDFENTINKNFNTRLDITKEKDHPFFDKLIPEYINKHFKLFTDGKAARLSYVGFELDKESVYCYFEVLNLPTVSKMDVETNLLYDLTQEQINIIHARANGKRHSAKLQYPAAKVSFSF